VDDPGANSATTDAARPATIDPAIAPGMTIAGRYVVRGRIGAGGMGTVWRVWDETAREELALKVLPGGQGEEALERFRREVTLARRIAHPGVGRVFDLGEAQGVRFLTMELVEGESLRERLRRGGVGREEGARIVDEMLEALAAVHAAGVVHRDVKPENVLLAAGGRVVLVDFGLARAPSRGGTTEPQLGTPEYMSPERLKGEAVELASDVFAASVVAWEVLGGRPAFGGGTSALVASAILRDPPGRLELPGATEEVRAAVEAVLARGLAKSPADRQADAGRLRRELAAALGGAPDRGSRTETRPSPRPRSRSSIVAQTVVALAIVGAMTFLAWRATRPAPERADAVDRDPDPGPGPGPDPGPDLDLDLDRSSAPIGIAVPPFTNVTGDPRWDPLAASLTHAGRGALASTPGVGVDDHGSFTLAGAVQLLDGKLRVTLALRGPDGKAGAPLDLDSDPADTSTLVDRVRTRVLDEIRLLAADLTRRREAERATSSPVARERLLAYYDLTGLSPRQTHVDVGLKLLDEAIAADGSYVPALVARGFLHLLRAARGDGDAARAQAAADLDRAVSLAPRDPEARAMRCRARALAVVGADDPDDAEVAAAVDECETALALGARGGAVHEALGRLLDFRCEDDRAAAALEQAMAGDRGRSGRVLLHLVELALQNERPAVADRLSRELLAFSDEERRDGERSVSARAGIAPTAGAHLQRAGVLLRVGRPDEARAQLLAELDTGGAAPCAGCSPSRPRAARRRPRTPPRGWPPSRRSGARRRPRIRRRATCPP
jgi:serine/threonine-protein kinase